MLFPAVFPRGSGSLPGVKVPAVRGRHRQLHTAGRRGEATTVEQELPATFKHLMVAEVWPHGLLKPLWLCCWPWGRASLLSLAGVALTVLKDLAPVDGGTEGEEDASRDASVKSKCS